MNDFVFQEGQWVWERSGVPFTYKNWDSDYSDGGNCLFIFTDRHGMWFSQETQIESVNLHKMSNKPKKLFSGKTLNRSHSHNACLC